MSEADNEAASDRGAGGGLMGLLRRVGPAFAFVAGLLVIPLKLAQLVATRQWFFSFEDLAATVQQIDAAGWISIALIFVEGLLAGAVFMFAVSYSLTFQQNIGKIGDDVTNEIGRVGDDIINVISSAPPPVLTPPADSITVDADSKAWIEGLLRRAVEQAGRDSSALAQQLSDNEAELEAVRQDLVAERLAGRTKDARISFLENELSKSSDESARSRSLVAQLKPLIKDMKNLGEEAGSRLGEPSLREDEQRDPPVS